MFKLWRDYAAAEVEIHLQFLFAFYKYVRTSCVSSYLTCLSV
jgi:hypothetical protein